MYALKIDENDSILELTVEDNLNEDDFRTLLRDLRHHRRQFTKGYKFLIILPPDMREGNIDEREKIDLNAYAAKLRGLKQVILQTPDRNSPHVEKLRDIYRSLSIKVCITHDHIESQKRLGVFWKL